VLRAFVRWGWWEEPFYPFISGAGTDPLNYY
jgi:hypothetical protein